MAITFDGPGKIITLDTATLSYSAAEIYSRWKDWTVMSDNSKFLPAFAGSVGGEDLGAGSRAPVFVFLRNDLGWRIRRPAADIDVTINGNLLGADPGLPILIDPVGAFTPSITLNRQNVASVNSVTLSQQEFNVLMLNVPSATKQGYNADLTDVANAVLDQTV